MFKTKNTLLLLGSILLGLTLLSNIIGCHTTEPVKTISLPTRMDLTPYFTTTPSQIQENMVLRSTTTPITAIASPTPTPYLYTVVKDDTLTSIAYNHNVKLTDLIAVNPGIDPNFLTIGLSITIPITGNNLIQSLLPTPIPLNVQEPICYLDITGSRTCLSLITNNQPFPLENISAQITLKSTEDAHQQSINAATPLNMLPSGESTIISAYFPPPQPENIVPKIKILSVIPVQEGSQRYPQLIINSSNIDINHDSKQAKVSGEIPIPNDNQIIDYIWVVAVALDKNKNPIGFRKWTSDLIMRKEKELYFDFSVQSFGPPIAEINVSYEAINSNIP
jgi:LysM repeat protein